MADKKLTPAQMKIAKLAKPFDKITKEDFAVLRSKRGTKVKGEAKKPMQFGDKKIKGNPVKPMKFTMKGQKVFSEKPIVSERTKENVSNFLKDDKVYGPASGLRNLIRNVGKAVKKTAIMFK